MITWHIERRKIADLIEYEGNPRDLTEKGLKDLKVSIKKFGCAEPPTINTDNVICGGHGRKKVLEDMAITEVDCYVPDRTLTPDEMRELNIRLNKNIAGKWNFDILSSGYEVPELVDFGFEEWELGLGSEEQSVGIDKKDEICENDCKEDNEKLAKFIEERKKSRERGNDKSETNFYICLIFQNYKEKMDFLNYIDSERENTLYNTFLNGEIFAEKFNIELKSKTSLKPFKCVVEKKLSEMVKK